MTDFPLTDEALTQWAKRNPRMAQQMHTDASLHQQYQINRLVLAHVERAMRDEGIAPEVRLRVINTAVFGAPDPDEVMTADQIQRVNEELLSMTDPNVTRLV